MSRTYKDSKQNILIPEKLRRINRFISKNNKCPQCEVDNKLSSLKLSKNVILCANYHIYKISFIYDEHMMIEFNRGERHYLYGEDFVKLEVYRDDNDDEPTAYDIDGIDGLVKIIKSYDNLKAFW